MRNMHKKLPVLILAIVFLLQAFTPAVFAASKNEVQSQTAYLCPFDPTSEGAGKGAETSLGANPFKGKTAAEIDQMFKAKGFELRGPDPLTGKGGYVNPKTGRSYHIDEANSFGEPPHVDVNRLRDYKGPLDKKKYDMGSGIR